MQIVLDQIENISPWDEIEESHLKDCVQWVKSGAQIYRIQKPDVPNKHLVSYCVLVDQNAQEMLLVEHKNAGLWLPCGGHVEINENPKVSADRELAEELNIHPEALFENPIFITKAVTVGMTAGHTDVSLWYVFKGKTGMPLDFDRSEFNSVKWFRFDGIPLDKTDPNLGRFLDKLKYLLKDHNAGTH